MTCVEESALQRYLIGLLTPAEVMAVDAHLKDCADCRARLEQRAPVKPPDEAIRPKVDALRVGLAQAKALLDAGRYKQGLERAKELVASSRELRYLPVQAEASKQVALTNAFLAAQGAP